MPNRLANENSPYLLQHAHNPVDWYPWGQEALEAARRQNKPIFLSIGYAACHWCHVMERESFENQQTADLLNTHFIAIKVDREQRPDLDRIYMQAAHALSNSGGWPLSIFLTPDLHPFYAGTYFPPVRRYNMPAFTEVLTHLARAWQDTPAEVERVGAEVLARIRPTAAPPGGRPLSSGLLQDAATRLVQTYDQEHGGWGRAPKFPQAMAIDFLLRVSVGSSAVGVESSSTAVHALKAMARGGMYDVVGGGFSRYSTDDAWRLPHFEKMLYDNALLALAYLHAWQLTHDPFCRRIVIETLDFVMSEMVNAEGGFYSSLDADSDGAEGKFYVWTKDNLREALADDSLFEIFVAAYGLTTSGNWEGKTVLQRALDDASLASRFRVDEAAILRRLAQGRGQLLRARNSRIRPATDDKVICSWNGLMLRAFAEAGRFLDEEDRRATYTSVATRNASFLLTGLRPDAGLRRVWRNGSASREVFLEDFAALILGLLDLYQSDFDNRWFIAAQDLAGQMISRFKDPEGGFFDTPSDGEPLLIRPKDLQDGATPSGNALACEVLLELAALGGPVHYSDLAEQALGMIAEDAKRYPLAFAHWLNVAAFAFGDQQQLAIVYPPKSKPEALLRTANSRFRPNLVLAASEFPPPPQAPALLLDRPLRDGMPTAYLCHHFTCKLPVGTAEDLERQF